MRWKSEFVTWAGAAALVSAVAFVPGWQSAESKVPADEKPLKQRRVKAFELAVNSMDVAGTTEVISCFDYVCRGTLTTVLGTAGRDYQLVRAITRGQMFPSPCDEVFASIDRRLLARQAQTRWIRLDGPATTPVGCFTGRLSVFAFVDDAEIEIFSAVLRGTSGFRPAQADPSINTVDPESDKRCAEPLRDEGCYVARFNKKGLGKISDDLIVDLSGKPLKKFITLLSRCSIEGTFEGTLEVDVMRDFCALSQGQWWYDGLMKCPCKPTDLDPRDPGTIGGGG